MNSEDDPSSICGEIICGEMDIPTFHRWMFVGITLRLVMCFLLAITTIQNCH